MSKTKLESDSLPQTPVRFLWWAIKPHWLIGLIGISLGIGFQILTTYVSVYIGRFVDVVPATDNPEVFLHWGLGFVAILAGMFILIRANALIAIPFILRLNARASIGARHHLLFHSNSYFEDRFAGALTTKVFNVSDRGSELVTMFYHGFTRITVSIIAAGVALAFTSIPLALGYLAFIILAILGNYLLVRYRRKFVITFSLANSKFRGYVNDAVANIQAVRQYTRRAREMVDLNHSLYDRNRKDAHQWRLGEYNQIFNNVVTLVLAGVMVWWSYQLLLQGDATVGEMVIVMLLMYRVSGVITDMAEWMNRVIRVYGEVEEGFNEVLQPHDIIDVPKAKPLTVAAGEIVWDDVSFEYKENAVFQDFSLTIPAGQRLGLVGASGAGKSTFVSLLLRQHDLGNGAIRIDGQEIATVTQDSLRENIAIVPQEPALFHRTIRENIAYGNPDATDEEVIAVATQAQAHEFIKDLPEGYDTLVGERGVKLSGGQKQRVAIARAMLKNAPILVLDEATSALDSESEVAIQKALHTLMEGKTVIAIAHRLSTLREMDRIIVLEAGQIVEDGTHDELKQGSGTYQKLWEHQAGGFLTE